ncbi:MAG: YraN family protein [Pseudomonadota bacterium]
MSKIRRGATAHRAGLAAEDVAARVYEAEGAAILARRWRCEYGEIDLILRDGDMLVFAEVKRRAGPIYDDPVSPKQWRRLELAAETYIYQAQTGAAPARFDVVLVDDKGATEVIKNARETGNG